MLRSGTKPRYAPSASAAFLLGFATLYITQINNEQARQRPISYVNGVPELDSTEMGKKVASRLRETSSLDLSGCRLAKQVHILVYILQSTQILCSVTFSYWFWLPIA